MKEGGDVSFAEVWMSHMNRTVRGFLKWTIPIALSLCIWEAISRAGLVSAGLFPPPSKVWSALADWVLSGDLLRDLLFSVGRAFIGWALCATTGVALGMLTGRNRFAKTAFTPIFQVLRPLPPVAIIPLVIVWLGIGDAAKIFSIAFAVFFPVWINTHLGASAIPREYLWSARVLGASALRKALYVVFPAALPAIMAGVRTGVAMAFIMVYVSELAGASFGVGYRISVSYLAYRMDTMMAALAVLAGLGALADFTFAWSIRRAFPWTNHLIR
jgi:NitT/TauT family transport system permease protein